MVHDSKAIVLRRSRRENVRCELRQGYVDLSNDLYLYYLTFIQIMRFKYTRTNHVIACKMTEKFSVQFDPIYSHMTSVS